MKTIFKTILILTPLLLVGCATKLPSFAHVHVGHALSAWPATPKKQGLFTLAEELAVECTKASIKASELAEQGRYDEAIAESSKLVSLIGTADSNHSDEKAHYSFISAFTHASDHLRFSAESNDATPNLTSGLTKIVSQTDEIISRAKVIHQLASALNSINDKSTIDDAIQQLRILTVQNLEGGDGHYSLKEMRNDLADTLAREDPPYTAPEKKYLFGVVRLPDGTWFWNFKNSESNKSYGRYTY